MDSEVRGEPITTLAAPNAGFLLRHPAHFIALGFGAGLSPVAPGTGGTLRAIPIAATLRSVVPETGFVVAIVAFLAVGIWAAHVTGRHLGVPDHGAIVWDETVAFLVVLFFVGDDALKIVAAFGIFRCLDIWKPPPIGDLDRRYKNGFGVMADDLLAAFYTLVVLAIGQRLFG
jgi:phosphatidylglycerophosphatase A